MLQGLIEKDNERQVCDNLLWPFNLFNYESSAISAVSAVAIFKKEALKRARSATSTVLSIASYTVSGAMIGTYICPGWGTLIGGVIGLIVGIAMRLLE
jgi:hypothetical protein